MPEPGEVGPDFSIRDRRFPPYRGPGGPPLPGGKPPAKPKPGKPPPFLVPTILPGAVPVVVPTPSPLDGLKGPRVAVFPKVPAANQPVFSILGRIIARGVGVIGGAIILGDIIRMGQEELIERKIREAEAAAVLERVLRRARRGKPVRAFERPPGRTMPVNVPKRIQRQKQRQNTQRRLEQQRRKLRKDATRVARKVGKIELPGGGGGAEIPQKKPLRVRIPRPELPDFETIPETQPATSPQTSPKPSTSPRPTKRTSTVKIPRPSRVVFPGASPLFGFPIFIPKRGSTPTRIPQRLTPAQATGLSSATSAIVSVATSTALSTATAGLSAVPPRRGTATRRCQEVKRRRRRKGKCREGFFEELPGKTRYTEWRTVDCITRKRIKD